MTLKAPIIIVGGGLAGALAALALAQRRPEIPLLLLEGGERFGGNHTWSFFDSDVPPAMRDLVAALRPVRWRHHQVRFPARERILAMAYNAISAPSLDALVRRRLPAKQWRVGATVAGISANQVWLEGGETINASAVVDVRGPDVPMPGLELGWQKFVGIEFAVTNPTSDCPTIMDATIPQVDGYRFVYTLPFAKDRVLIEDTYYSTSPVLDEAAVATLVRALAHERGFAGEEIRRETGVLPILIGGNPEKFWPADDPVSRLGLRGGFFHPTTGYSFSLALKMADSMASLSGRFDGPSLARWSRSHFLRHWERGRYFRLLNTMLFHAAEPDQRYRIFEHFYRLPPELIGRFYAGELCKTDKLRILTGSPPVPVGAAIRALAGLAKGA